MNIIIKSIIILTILINTTYSFDCNMFPIIKKLFNKDTCYNKCKKNYVSHSTTIKNRSRTNKNYYKMTSTNINLRNSTKVSKETEDFSKYLDNTAPSSNN